MRGPENEIVPSFFFFDIEQRLAADHPLRIIKALIDPVLKRMSPSFDEMYSWTGRPSIPPEYLLRALVLQTLYSIRSERLLMEEMEFHLAYRWFVGLRADEPVWDATVFSNLPGVRQGIGNGCWSTRCPGCSLRRFGRSSTRAVWPAMSTSAWTGPSWKPGPV